MEFTRIRDLAAVGLVSLLAGYLLVRLSYQRIPPLPSLAGLAAAVLGAAEAVAGWGLRSRIRASRDPDDRSERRPVPPLLAARAVLTAKASSLAGAALCGLWLGVLVYVAPIAGQVSAARDDVPAAVIGIVGSLVMAAGALYLEHCLRTPTGAGDGRRGDR
ncbi:membrane protein [Nakamurella endophytica]|uniref:Membrane protein n=2 Tax=Nakamurella endophytica TaxID=1748367 RepID=A0A917WHF6_9ACTN|nr:membrane protein [Nakamurella endophytica]